MSSGRGRKRRAPALGSRTAGLAAGAGEQLRGSEADFLLRRSLVPVAAEGEGAPRAEEAALRGADRLSASLSASLRERERALDALDAAEERARSLASTVVALKSQHAAEIRALAAAHESAVLQLSREHGEELSAAAGGGAGAGGLGTQAAVENARRLEARAEALSEELRRTRSAFADERRDLKVDAAARLLAQERAMRAEAAALQDRLCASEDQTALLAEQLMAMQTQTATLRASCEQLEEARRGDAGREARLRADLKAMQLTVAASYRADGRGEEGRLSEAQAEAKHRQLANMVDFLRAQVASEQRAGEDQERLVTELQGAADGLRAEMRARAEEAERALAQASEDAERRAEARMAEQLADVASVRTRLALLQTQLQEALAEGAAARGREDAARGLALKAQAQLGTARQEQERLGSLLQEARLREQAVPEGAGRASGEAAVRRLENEKQYLKSQLASEATLKGELQGALQGARHQLEELQSQWRADVAELRERAEEGPRLASADNARLQQEAALARVEAAQLGAQSGELRGAVARLRDQVRVEAFAGEGLRAANKRLCEEAQGLREDAARAADNEARAEALHGQQLAALCESLQRQEEERAAEGDRHRAAVARLRAALADEKERALLARDEGEALRLEEARLRGAAVLGGRLGGWRRTRLAQAFRRWGATSALLGAAGQFRARLEGAVRAAVEGAEAAGAEATDALVAQLRVERDDVVGSLRAAHSAETRRLRLELSAERGAALEQLALTSAEAEAALRAEGARALEAAQGEREALLLLLERERAVDAAGFENRLEQDRAEWRLRVAESAALAREQACAEERALWEGRAREREARVEGELASAAVEAVARAEERWRERECLAAAEAAAARRRAAEEAASALEDLSLAHAAALAERSAEWGRREELRAEAAAVELARRLELQREEDAGRGERALLDLREALADEAYDALAARDKDWRDRLALQEEVQTRSFDAEKSRALSLEASKWQQSLREMEAAFGIEAARIRREGWDERDGAAKAEALAQVARAAEAREAASQQFAAELEQQSRLCAAQLADKERQMDGERARWASEAAAVEDRAREGGAALGDLREQLRQREEQLAALQSDAEGMRNSFETVCRAVAEKDKRIRLYARRLQDEVEAERRVCELREGAARLGAERATEALWMASLAAREEELGAEAAARVEALRVEHEAALRASAQRHDLAAAAIREEAAANLQQTVAELSQRRETELASLEQRLRAEGDGRVAAATDARANELAELRRAMHEEAEARVRELREVWEDELYDKLKGSEREQQERLNDALQRAEMQAVNDLLQSLRLEASKWQQVLKENEAKTAVAVDVARAAGWEQRDKEALAEVSKLERRIESIMVKFKDADAEMNRMQRGHDEVLAEERVRHEREVERLVAEGRAAERTQRDEEWTKRMHSARDDFLDREQVLGERLAREEYSKEVLRDDLLKQLAKLGEEKGQLLENLENANQQLVYEREAHLSEKADLRLDFENDAALRILQSSRNQKVAVQELQSQQNRLMEEAEERWERIADSRVGAEAAAINAEKESAIAVIRSHYEKESDELNSALRMYKAELAEKTELALDLTTKLEAADDRLYDEEQRAKQRALDGAFMRWTALCNGFKMRTKFQATVAKVEATFSSQLAEAESLHAEKLNAMTYAAIQISALVQATENSRKRTYATLTSHKTEVVVERRSQIRLFEKELQRMSNEREALEDGRLRVEEEIAALGQQVSALEEEIYEHTRSSTMQHGRINVAHVRRKRRLDSELEKLLELIEVKRALLGECDDKVAAKCRQRDEKELSLVELERDLTRILVEQQRLVLLIVDDDSAIAESCRHQLTEVGLPWPPPAKVSLSDAQSFISLPAVEDSKRYSGTRVL